MYKQNWEIRTQENFGGLNVRIYIINKSERLKLAHIKDGRIELEDIVESSELEPTLTLPLEVWEILKQQMTENHERDKHTVEAELGATKYHLEDMRKLVFTPPPHLQRTSNK